MSASPMGDYRLYLYENWVSFLIIILLIIKNVLEVIE